MLLLLTLSRHKFAGYEFTMKEMKELLTDGINHKNNTHRELLSKQIKGVLNLKPTKITRKFPLDKTALLSDVNNFELNNR